MTFSNTLANTILDVYFTDKTLYLSLHTTSPLMSELSTGEIDAPTYSRQLVDWSEASNRSVTNTANLTFSGLPLATIPYLGVYSAVTGGILYAVLESDPPYQSNSNGSTIYIPAETLIIGLE